MKEIKIDERKRDELGLFVRLAWVEYCQSIGDAKPSHIAPYHELSEADKEADRCIGEAIYQYALYDYFTRNAPPGCAYCGKFVPRSAVYTEHDIYGGGSGAAWKCPHCGETTHQI